MESLYSVKLGEVIKKFHLEVLRGGEGYEDLPIRTEDVNRPGLQLTGFFDYFDPRRLQVIGRVEATYLDGLTPDQRRERFERLLSQDIVHAKSDCNRNLEAVEVDLDLSGEHVFGSLLPVGVVLVGTIINLPLLIQFGSTISFVSNILLRSLSCDRVGSVVGVDSQEVIGGIESDICIKLRIRAELDTHVGGKCDREEVGCVTCFCGHRQHISLCEACLFDVVSVIIFLCIAIKVGLIAIICLTVLE